MVAAGQITGLDGAKGGLTLKLFGEINTEEPVFVKIEGHRVPLFFSSFRRRGANGAVAVFDDIDTPARAAELVGLEFYVKGEEEVDEDFIGWPADLGGGVEGRVKDFFAGANPLFEVEVSGGVELIPAAFVEKVEKKSQKIVFAIPEGLLGLNR